MDNTKSVAETQKTPPNEVKAAKVKKSEQEVNAAKEGTIEKERTVSKDEKAEKKRKASRDDNAEKDSKRAKDENADKEAKIAKGETESNSKIKEEEESSDESLEADKGSQFPNKGPDLIQVMDEIDDAVKLCGFGFFQVRFFVAVLFANIYNILIAVGPSYLLPNAPELQMTLIQKGMLNAAAYVGMFSSCVYASYAVETYGRKKFLVFGYLLIFLTGGVLGGLCPNLPSLLVVKILEGFIFSGAMNALLSMCSEMTHRKNRNRFIIITSSCAAMGHVIGTLYSWMVLPKTDWKFNLFGITNIYCWNIYIFGCGTYALIASIMFMFLPESPRWLVHQQRYKDAFQIVKNIYKENKGRHHEFPMSSIGPNLASKISQNVTTTKKRKKFWKRAKPLFTMPLVLKLILICLLQSMSMMTYNVFRLWYPQISTIIEMYTQNNNKSAKLCSMLNAYARDDKKSIKKAEKSGNETYRNGIILGVICLFPYLLLAPLMRRYGRKILLIISLVISSLTILLMLAAENGNQIMFLTSITVALTMASVSVYQSYNIEFFPGFTKQLAISISVMSGRCGSVVGNVIFPILLRQKCELSILTFFGVVLALLMLTLKLST